MARDRRRAREGSFCVGGPEGTWAGLARAWDVFVSAGRRVTWSDSPHVAQHVLFVLDLGVDLHRGARLGCGGSGQADIRVLVAGGEHQLLDSYSELLGRAVVVGGELLHGAVDVGLSPELAGAVVEQVEVVGVIALLLDDLELDVLIVEVVIESG